MGEDVELNTPIDLTDNEEVKARGLATSIEELPPLPEGYCRGVHITSPDRALQIIVSGLDYSRQGMLMSTARVWSNAEEVDYKSNDWRFGEGTVDVVFDLTFAETKIHNKFPDAPGLITPDHIVGIIDPYQNV